MAINEESLRNMISAMGREIGNAIATANTAAQNASAARATDDRAALLQSMRGLVRSSGGERYERTDRKASEKEDLSASIIKAQSVTPMMTQHAVSHSTSHILDDGSPAA